MSGDERQPSWLTGRAQPPCQPLAAHRHGRSGPYQGTIAPEPCQLHMRTPTLTPCARPSRLPAPPGPDKPRHGSCVSRSLVSPCLETSRLQIGDSVIVRFSRGSSSRSLSNMLRLLPFSASWVAGLVFSCFGERVSGARLWGFVWASGRWINLFAGQAGDFANKTRHTSQESKGRELAPPPRRKASDHFCQDLISSS